MTLQLAPDLIIDDDFVTKTSAIIAQKSKGKTYTSALIEEELCEAGWPWVALDPTGAHWGIRSSADGEGPGYAVTVIGGDHGDIPLTRNMGAAVADLVVDHPGWYVVDMSLLGSRAAEREFATDFANRLYRRKSSAEHRTPLLLIIDEADLFIPQEREGQGDNLMLGAFNNIVRRGAILGLGVLMISQRPALVNKNALTMIDVLILLRLVGGNDQDYLDKNYISRSATKEQRALVMSALASLPVGTGWVFEPAADPPLLVQIAFRERRTFNSSARPKVGGKPALTAKVLADVDLAAIHVALREAIEQAQSDDPKVLQEQVATLTRELADARRAADAHVCAADAHEIPAPEVIQEMVPFVPEDVLHGVEELEREARDLLQGALGSLDGAILSLTGCRDLLAERADGLEAAITGVDAALDTAEAVTTSPIPPPPPRRAAAPAPAPVAPPAQVGDVTIGKGERTVMAVLAGYPDGLPMDRLAFEAGYSAGASTIGNIVARLRRAGLAHPDQPVRLTAAGAKTIGGFTPPPKGKALWDQWMNHPRIGEGERKVLTVLRREYPRNLTHTQLCDATGYSPDASTIGNILSRLRKLGLVPKGARTLSADFYNAVKG